MIRTLIVDDHLLIREGFKKIIAEEVDISVVGMCENATEVMEFIQKNACDVIVLDIDMPDKSGLDLLVDIKMLKPDIKVLMQSIFQEEQFAIRSLKAGASGYITKDAAAEELVQAIQKVYYGRKYISQNLAEELAFYLENGQSQAHALLSNREFQILQLIALGQSTNEISEKLSLSQNTVNTYRKRILQKTGLGSTAKLIHYAIRNNLVV